MRDGSGYRMQIQANLLFSDREWCDYVTYDPRVFNSDQNIHVIKIARDEEIISLIEERIGLITDLFKEITDKLGI